MKRIKSTLSVALWLLVSVMICGSAAVFTSCGNNTLEEIIGNSDVPSSVVKVLGDALNAGAIVTVNYNVGGTEYVAKFQKNSDDSYILISNTTVSGTRALTRASVYHPIVPTGNGAAVGDKVKLIVDGGSLKFIVKDENDAPLFEAHMNIDSGKIAMINTNAFGIDCSIGILSVNGQSKEIKNPVMQKATISYDYEIRNGNDVSYSKFIFAVQYNKDHGDTWASVIERYKGCEQAVIKAIGGYVAVRFSKDVVKVILKDKISDAALLADAVNDVTEKTFFLISSDPGAAQRTFVKVSDKVGILDVYVLTDDGPDVEKQFSVLDRYDAITLTIPLGDNVKWKRIADINPDLTYDNDNGKYNIVVDEKKYYLYTSQDEIILSSKAVYNPDKTYIFRELLKHYIYGDVANHPEQTPFQPAAWDAADMRFSDKYGHHLPTIPDDVYFGLKTLIFDVSDVSPDFDLKVMNGWWSNTYYDHVKWTSGLNTIQITETMANECTMVVEEGETRDLDLMLYSGSMTLNAVYYED